MPTRTGVTAMQEADELGLDPAKGYESVMDPLSVPNGYPAVNVPPKEQDGVEAELYGDSTREDMGAFARLAKIPANEDRPKAPRGGGHNENLCLQLPEMERSRLARELLQEIDSAENSRKPWRDLAVKGIKALGFDRSMDKRSDPFPGASAVVHPAYAKALVDMAARTAAQIAPPEGPAGTKIVGDETPQKRDAADRIGEFINWQCTEQMPEWSAETDRLLMMVGAEGSSFKKAWYCTVEKRPKVAYIPAEHIIMPYSATCEMTSPLVAEEMWPLTHEVTAKVGSGFWSDHIIGEPTDRPLSEIKLATDSLVGVDPSGSEDEPQYRGLQYYECMVTRAIPGLEGGEPREYLVTVARNHEQLVSVRRNWRMSDKLKRRRRTLQHYKLFPWRGAYGLGLWHLIGGLSTSATGSLRALLDSAHWQNMPGGYRLKPSRTSGGTISRAPGEIVDIEAAPGVTDIRMAIMADPHPGPSPVLFELLGFVTQAATEFAGIALQDVERDTANTPVGTTLARMDEGSRVYSSIFARLHRAQSLELNAIHQIDIETLAEQIEFHGDAMPEINPDDFGPGVKVVPASDPRTYSQLQQTMKAQARIDLAERAKAQGEQVNLREAYKDAFGAMQLGDPAAIFPPDPEPFSGDPFTENATLITGGKLLAQPAQPHEEHLMVHLGLLSLPGMIATPAGQGLMQHMIGHAGFGALAMAAGAKMAAENGIPTDGMLDPGEWYVSWMERIAPAMLPPGDPSVDRLVKVEQSKVEATREKVLIETDAKKEIVAVETEAEKEVVAAQLAADLRKIEAEDDRAEAKALVDVTNQREQTASKERQKAADIMARAATPPPPRPMPNPPGKKPKDKA